MTAAVPIFRHEWSSSMHYWSTTILAAPERLTLGLDSIASIELYTYRATEEVALRTRVVSASPPVPRRSSVICVPMWFVIDFQTLRRTGENVCA